MRVKGLGLGVWGLTFGVQGSGFRVQGSGFRVQGYGYLDKKYCSRHVAVVSRHLPERELSIDNLLVRIHFIIVMIRWTGFAPWEFEFPFPGSLTSTFLQLESNCGGC